MTCPRSPSWDTNSKAHERFSEWEQDGVAWDEQSGKREALEWRLESSGRRTVAREGGSEMGRWEKQEEEFLPRGRDRLAQCC